MNEDVCSAGKLAQWLIEKKEVDKKKAYIIAARKYRVENWHDVQKYYNQELKPKQIQLL